MYVGVDMTTIITKQFREVELVMCIQKNHHHHRLCESMIITILSTKRSMVASELSVYVTLLTTYPH